MGGNFPPCHWPTPDIFCGCHLGSTKHPSKGDGRGEDPILKIKANLTLLWLIRY